MFSSVLSGGINGMDSYIVHVEVDTSHGLPEFRMVGLLGSEVRESRDRVHVALKNCGIHIPPLCINVNISPADIRKDGTGFDLPIAVGMLASLESIPQENLNDTFIVGELGLSGEIKPVKGILPLTASAREYGMKRCIVPFENAAEGAVIDGIDVIVVKDLTQVLEYLMSGAEVCDDIIAPTRFDMSSLNCDHESQEVDFADINGQEAVKRASEISAAGFHHFLMVGPPGSGKTMIAKRLPTIMPPLSLEESLEVSSIYSVAGMLPADAPLIVQRPFLSPHHTITEPALTGGGRIPKPGIISLSHRGVLFLDELPEFSRRTLDLLRQPLEDREIHIARSYGSYTFPADFLMAAAMNPCPCGYFPDRNLCHCDEHEVHKYLSRVSGPILDRVDICVEAPRVKLEELNADTANETSAQIRARVMAARERQELRFRGTSVKFNSEMNPAEVRRFCRLDHAGDKLIEESFKALGLSARAYHRTLKVARTIADVDGSDEIREIHIAEAVSYRMNDMKYWNA